MPLFPGRGGRVIPDPASDWDDDDDWEEEQDEPVAYDVVDDDWPEATSIEERVAEVDAAEQEEEPHVPVYFWGVQSSGDALFILHNTIPGKVRMHPLENIKYIAVNPNDLGNGVDVEIVIEEVSKAKEYCYRGCRLLSQFGSPMPENGTGTWITEISVLRSRAVKNAS